MIDGSKVADDLIHARYISAGRGTYGLVLSPENTAALASYIAKLREENISLQLTRQAYQHLLNTHTPHVVGNINDYISQAEEALQNLRQYVASQG